MMAESHVTPKETIAKIAELRANGLTQAQIGANIGKSREMVKDKLKNEEVQELISKIRNEFYQECLPQAVENYKQFLTARVKNNQQRYLKYASSKDVLQGANVIVGLEWPQQVQPRVTVNVGVKVGGAAKSTGPSNSVEQKDE